MKSFSPVEIIGLKVGYFVNFAAKTGILWLNYNKESL